MRAALQASREYGAIVVAYGDRTARRSGVPLIQHIDHGLAILAALGASLAARRAYCLHPLLQGDADLVAHAPRLAALTDDPYVVLLAMEYRHVANATLSTRATTAAADITLSPLAEVNLMLVADKVQNRRDFELHHEATHARSAELALYFRRWLERLGVSEARYHALATTR